MRVSECVGCKAFPCADVKHECYLIPDIVLNPADIAIILISEAAPANPNDYYYANGDPLFQQTTVLAFNDAGAEVASIDELLEAGYVLHYSREVRENGLWHKGQHDQRMLTSSWRKN